MGSSTLTIQQALSLYVVSELDLLDDVAAKKVHVEVVSHVSGDVLMLSQADCAELYFLRDLPITALDCLRKSGPCFERGSALIWS